MKHTLNSKPELVLDQATEELLLIATQPAEPSPERRQAMRERILARVHAPGQTGLHDFLTIREGEGEWQEFSAGVRKKQLFNDGENEAFLIRMEPGTRCPPHDHHADEECVVLSGEVWLGDVFVRAGDFHLAPKGRPHAEIYSPKGVLLYVRTGVAPG
jgi:quercetin dioxygenase-like cupin family protein